MNYLIALTTAFITIMVGACGIQNDHAANTLDSEITTPDLKLEGGFPELGSGIDLISGEFKKTCVVDKDLEPRKLIDYNDVPRPIVINSHNELLAHLRMQPGTWLRGFTLGSSGAQEGKLIAKAPDTIQSTPIEPYSINILVRGVRAYAQAVIPEDRRIPREATTKILADVNASSTSEEQKTAYQNFRSRCGDAMVVGERYGRRMAILINIKTTTRDERDALVEKINNAATLVEELRLLKGSIVYQDVQGGSLDLGASVDLPTALEARKAFLSASYDNIPFQQIPAVDLIVNPYDEEDEFQALLAPFSELIRDAKKIRADAIKTTLAMSRAITRRDQYQYIQKNLTQFDAVVDDYSVRTSTFPDTATYVDIAKREMEITLKDTYACLKNLHQDLYAPTCWESDAEKFRTYLPVRKVKQP